MARMTRLRATLAALAAPILILAALAQPAAAAAQPRAAHPPAAHLVLQPAGVTVEHGKRISWYHICTYSEQSLCEIANGAGNTITVVPSGYNKWQAIGLANGNIEWQNGSGNCMKASTPGDFVTVINGPCDGGSNKRWAVGGSGNVTFYSAYAAGYMGVNGHPFNGSQVVIGQAATGFYRGWITFGCC